MEVVSRGVISSSPIEDNYDVYEIAKFRHTGFDPDHDYSKVSISPMYKDFTIMFSGQEAASADGKTMQTVGLDEPFSMVLKGNVLELPGSSEGVKTSFSLSESKKIGNNGVAKTLKISADGKDFQTFPLPTPILGEKVPSFGIVSAVAKGAMTFNIEPATDGSILYVQWNNLKKHENGQTYETVIQEIPADGKIEIPVEDTAAGTYKLYVSRIKLGEATLGDAKICVDAGATVVSQLKVSEEESK
ncbi:MAG: hypothetical protein R3A45_10110 [Bdellovibrionota bacterium]